MHLPLPSSNPSSGDRGDQSEDGSLLSRLLILATFHLPPNNSNRGGAQLKGRFTHTLHSCRGVAWLTSYTCSSQPSYLPCSSSTCTRQTIPLTPSTYAVPPNNQITQRVGGGTYSEAFASANVKTNQRCYQGAQACP